jgi:hypothetical protein
MGQSLEVMNRQISTNRELAKSLLASGMPNDPKTQIVWQLLQKAKDIKTLVAADRFSKLVGTGYTATPEQTLSVIGALSRNENLPYLYSLIFLTKNFMMGILDLQIILWEHVFPKEERMRTLLSKIFLNRIISAKVPRLIKDSTVIASKL